MNNPVLEVKNLVKSFGSGAAGFTAIDDISFKLGEGEILGFLGPNGAGKSTTIFCILGLIKPDGGEVNIFGKNVLKEKQVLGKVNYAAAEFILPWNLTIPESLLVFATLYQIPNPKKRIDELMDIFEISHLKNQTVRDLSMGQRTRGNLCKAFLNKPKLLLLDEPMASMDPDVVDKGISLIRRLQQEENMSILYTSHNMWEIEEIAENVVFINHGKIVAQGSPLELTKKVLKSKTDEVDLREVFIHISRSQDESS